MNDEGGGLIDEGGELRDERLFVRHTSTLLSEASLLNSCTPFKKD